MKVAKGNANVGPWHVAHTTSPVTYRLPDWLEPHATFALFDRIKYLQMATLNGLTPKSINQSWNSFCNFKCILPFSMSCGSAAWSCPPSVAFLQHHPWSRKLTLSCWYVALFICNIYHHKAFASTSSPTWTRGMNATRCCGNVSTSPGHWGGQKGRRSSTALHCVMAATKTSSDLHKNRVNMPAWGCSIEAIPSLVFADHFVKGLGWF